MIKIQKTSDHPDLISARALRLTIGLLAFLLPVILIIGAAILDNCQFVQNSISAYYHTIMRNFFVGALSAIALALFVYRGYGSTDNMVGNLAAICTLGVAFFPTSVDGPFTPCLPDEIVGGIYSSFHFISAAFLFVLLAFFCLVLFTRTKEGKEPSHNKLKRNVIYKFCGYIIVGCIIAIALYFFVLKSRFPVLSDYRPVFIFEALALGAFSISWLVKGEAVLRDD